MSPGDVIRGGVSLELPRRSDLCSWPQHGEDGTQLILGYTHRTIQHVRCETLAAEMVDKFNCSQDGWVLGAALGSGFHFKGLDGDARLAAEDEAERVGGAGGEAGQQHFKRSWIGARRGGIIHFEELVADLHVDAHVSKLNGANG
jgi:hypothetical protein